MLMRTSKALALLAEAERRHDRERVSLTEERQRLLDRIMVLAERPMPYAAPFTEREPAPDVVWPEEIDDHDDFLPPARVNGNHGPRIPVRDRP